MVCVSKAISANYVPSTSFAAVNVEYALRKTLLNAKMQVDVNMLNCML